MSAQHVGVASLVKSKIITSTLPPAGPQTMGTLRLPRRSSVTLSVLTSITFNKVGLIKLEVSPYLVSSDNRETGVLYAPR